MDKQAKRACYADLAQTDRSALIRVGIDAFCKFFSCYSTRFYLSLALKVGRRWTLVGLQRQRLPLPRCVVEDEEALEEFLGWCVGDIGMWDLTFTELETMEVLLWHEACISVAKILSKLGLESWSSALDLGWTPTPGQAARRVDAVGPQQPAIEGWTL